MRAGEMTFLVETDELVDVPEGLQPVVSTEQLEREFAEVQDLIVTCCNGLHKALTRIPRPESVGVEFGIKLAGEAGIPMLTKASGEANFKVTIAWKPGQEQAGSTASKE